MLVTSITKSINITNSELVFNTWRLRLSREVAYNSLLTTQTKFSPNPTVYYINNPNQFLTKFPMAFHSDHRNTKKPLLYADLFKSEENSGWISTSSTHSSSPSGSSSSSFTSPLQYSDFDDEDFIEKLTRQVTECMLDEEDEEEDKIPDDGTPPIQVYELKNQPTVTKEKVLQRNMMQYGGRNGSDMQAVFLGGPGSKKTPPGTGVFLPDSTRRKNKSAGCSMVLIPTRVLHTLDLHFKQRHQSGGGSQLQSSPKDESRQVEQGDDEIQLPQEWTY